MNYSLDLKLDRDEAYWLTIVLVDGLLKYEDNPVMCGFINTILDSIKGDTK